MACERLWWLVTRTGVFGCWAERYRRRPGIPQCPGCDCGPRWSSRWCWHWVWWRSAFRVDGVVHRNDAARFCKRTMKSVAKAIDDVFQEGVTWCRLFIEELCLEAGQSRMAVRCCCVKRHSLFFSWNIEGYRIALQKLHCSREKGAPHFIARGV